MSLSSETTASPRSHNWQCPGQSSTATFAARLDLPHTSVRRHLEDQGARGASDKIHFTDPEAWVASEWTRTRWEAATGAKV
jgi:hypothetical protein